MTDELRARMSAAALKVADVSDYTNAGSVEFLYSNGNFYFMEMNTRLQVEHTITEFITGIDIVKQQIAVAAGESLPFEQQDISIRGHAISAGSMRKTRSTILPLTREDLRYRFAGRSRYPGGQRYPHGIHDPAQL